MKLPLSIALVALLLAATAFAGAVNVKFDSNAGLDRLGASVKNMTVGEAYIFSTRLYDQSGSEVPFMGGGSSRCIVTGGIGEANATDGICTFYAKKAGAGTLTYAYRAPDVGYDLTATIGLNTSAARCTM